MSGGDAGANKESGRSRRERSEWIRPEVRRKGGMSEREFEAFRLWHQGKSDAAIAARLGMTPGEARALVEQLVDRLRIPGRPR